MSNLTAEKSSELRKPFPKSAIGKLPKGGVQLDYVGHAAVTDRLLAVDPEWSWEPFAVDEQGLPALDRAGNLWIRLTVCGHTRIGVGDGKSAKEAIGDALRNAAMRFGVALDLWSKEELEHTTGQPGDVPREVNGEPKSERPAAPLGGRTEKQAKMLAVQMKQAGLTDRDEALSYFSGLIGRPLESTKDLTVAEASKVIDTLVDANKQGANPTTGEQRNYGGEDPWGAQ